MAGDDDETTPSERPGGIRLPRTRPGGGYSAHRPPQGREVIATRPGRLPTVGEDYSIATPLPVAMAVPEYVDERSDISAVSQKVDVAVRRAVATLPPPVARLTGVDIARVALGVVGTLCGALVIAMVTKGCGVISDVDAMKSKVNAVEGQVKDVGGKVDKVYDLLLRRP